MPALLASPYQRPHRTLKIPLRVRIVIQDAGWDWGPASDDPTSFQ